jgi:hypothetical protein
MQCFDFTIRFLAAYCGYNVRFGTVTGHLNSSAAYKTDG